MSRHSQSGTLLQSLQTAVPFVFHAEATAIRGRLIELDWRHILLSMQQGYTWPHTQAEALEDQIAFCLAAQHATTASFAPIHAAAQLRELLEAMSRRPESVQRIFEFSVQALRWPLSGISARYTELAGLGPVSEQHGFYLGWLTELWRLFLETRREQAAEQARSAIREELRRQSIEFQTALEQKDHEVEALCLSVWLHWNAEALENALAEWPEHLREEQDLRDFRHLSRGENKAFGGIFADAAHIYYAVMAPQSLSLEALKPITALRRSPDFLLPQAPFLDDWGSTIARHSALTEEERAQVLTAIITSWRHHPETLGYSRALCGMLEKLGESGLHELLLHCPNSVRHDYESTPLRRALAIGRGSFESSMRKALRRALTHP